MTKTHTFEAPFTIFNDVYFGRRKFLLINEKIVKGIKQGDELLLKEKTTKKVIQRQTKHLVGVVEKNSLGLKGEFIIISLI